jgi:hypothetical protein
MYMLMPISGSPGTNGAQEVTRQMEPSSLWTVVPPPMEEGET